MCKAASGGVTRIHNRSLQFQKTIFCHKRGSRGIDQRSNHYCLISSHLLLTSASEVLSIHENEVALEDLLGAEEIPLELGLVFLPPEIQCLYQEHQVAWREVLSHSPAHEVGSTLDTNSRKRGNRYRTPMLYLIRHTRKVYVADEHKQQYKESYDPNLDHHYDLYLCPHSYLRNLCSYLC